MPSLSGVVRRAERLARSGRWDEASKLVREAAKGAPRETRLLLRHASLLEAHSPSDALRAARKALESKPKSAAAYAIAARVALTAGEADEAVRLAGEALHRDAEHGLARTLQALGRMQAGKGPHESAVMLLREGVFEESSVVARAVLLLLRRWRELGPVRPPLVGDVARLHPSDAPTRTDVRGSARALYARVRDAYSRGDGQEMLPWVRALQQAAPDDTDVPAAFAAGYHLTGLDDLAEEWIERAMRVQADEAARLRRPKKERAKGKQEAAPKPIEEMASPEAVVLAASIALEQGDLARAGRLAELGSRRVNPFDRWEARLIRAQALDRQGHADQALDELAQAYMEEPTVLPLALHRVVGHAFLRAASQGIGAANKAGLAEVESALRHAMCRLLSDARRPRRDRTLARALDGAKLDVPAETAEILRTYAQGGLRAVAERKAR